MSLVEQLTDAELDSDWSRLDRLERQLKDYVSVSLRLVWQRQAIFFGAIFLTALYYDPTIALACYALILFTEFADLALARKIMTWNGRDSASARQYLVLLIVNTLMSALGICLWVILVAHQQGVGGHFMPHFFLFAAALFAAMNNHQLLPALILRLITYGATFLYIALRDIFLTRPPLTSELWLNLFTIIFVLYFVIDCSIVFLRLYRTGVQQLEELKIEHERTKAAYEVKTQFLATVSHELRTPLTSIKGSLELVNAGTLGEVPDRIQPVLEIAGRNAARLADLINDLLDLQKMEAGEMRFQMGQVNVNTLVREAVDASRGYAINLGMTLRCDYAPDEYFIEADQSRLLQVLANLLSNALKFSSPGSEVRVQVIPRGNKIRIAVTDEGIGIPEDARERVFGAFSQVDSSDQRKVGGTGLGLHITKRIVDRHNGVIDYESTLGEGTTFFVEFDRS